jgi:hypothetical protein
MPAVPKARFGAACACIIVRSERHGRGSALSSKLNAEWAFLDHAARRRPQGGADEPSSTTHGDALGKRSSFVDLDRLLAMV